MEFEIHQTYAPREKNEYPYAEAVYFQNHRHPGADEASIQSATRQTIGQGF